MTDFEKLDNPCPPATDGKIAALNLESMWRRAWIRFSEDAGRPGAAEALADMERMKVQFLGDMDALGRLEALAFQFDKIDGSYRAALVQAEAASAVHCFEDARNHLTRAMRMGAPNEIVEHQLLAIDQACGMAQDDILHARYRIAATSAKLEDLIPLGALLADLGRFAEADVIYRQAIYSYSGISPFPLAWACFQLGMLWGELVPEPDLDLAAQWYRRAITYLPGYAKARVHLAEIHISKGQPDDAEAILLPAASSGDPEIRWRLADLLTAQCRFEEAEIQLDAARCGFDQLLAKHPLAFADHAAAFYASSGNDPQRALELAQMNVANRPTRRAIKQAEEISGMMSGAVK